MNPNNEEPRVQFEEERVERPYPETSKMVKLVMTYSGGLVKSERQASYVLMGIVIVIIGISFYLFFGTSKTPSSSSPLAPFPEEFP